MRKILLTGIVLSFLTYVNCFTQDLINPPVLQNVHTSDQVFRGSMGFPLGWNWCSEGIKLDSAMYINSYHKLPNRYL